ncbi:MAG TPA: hypothetical protein VIY27_10935 [Myxococcota bacterium]
MTAIATAEVESARTHQEAAGSSMRAASRRWHHASAAAAANESWAPAEKSAAGSSASTHTAAHASGWSQRRLRRAVSATVSAATAIQARRTGTPQPASSA